MIRYLTTTAELLRPKVYVELGVFKGDTIKEIKPFCERAIAVDIKKNFDAEAHGIEFYNMTTDCFALEAAKQKLEIDMLYIDANHSYEQELRDFDNFFPFVKENGLIFIHDTYPADDMESGPAYCWDAWKVAWEIRTNRPGCEIVTLPFPPGVSIVRKASKQLAWR